MTEIRVKDPMQFTFERMAGYYGGIITKPISRWRFEHHSGESIELTERQGAALPDFYDYGFLNGQDFTSIDITRMKHAPWWVKAVEEALLPSGLVELVEGSKTEYHLSAKAKEGEFVVCYDDGNNEQILLSVETDKRGFMGFGTIGDYFRQGRGRFEKYDLKRCQN